jgi:Na+-translocating ferredoxin:NAD+ oxidoreductase RnfE subunit
VTRWLVLAPVAGLAAAVAFGLYLAWGVWAYLAIVPNGILLGIAAAYIAIDTGMWRSQP